MDEGPSFHVQRVFVRPLGCEIVNEFSSNWERKHRHKSSGGMMHTAKSTACKKKNQKYFKALINKEKNESMKISRMCFYKKISYKSDAFYSLLTIRVKVFKSKTNLTPDSSSFGNRQSG